MISIVGTIFYGDWQKMSIRTQNLYASCSLPTYFYVSRTTMILLCSQWREFAWKCSQLINFEPRLGGRSSKGTALTWWQMRNERVKSGKLDYHSRCSIPPMFFSFDVWFIQTRHTFDHFLNFVLEHVRVVKPWRLHLRVQHRRRRVENNRKRGQVYYRPGGYTS